MSLMPRKIVRVGGFVRRRVFLLVVCVGAIAGGSFTSVTPAYAVTPPSEVQTEPAEATASGVRLKGKLNPGGLPTTYHFDYNDDQEIECVELEECARETIEGGPVTGDTQQEVPPIEVTSLTKGATYCYWLVAKNADGTARGEPLTFTTPRESQNNGPGGQSRGQESKLELTLLVTPLVETTSTKPLTRAQKLAHAPKACECKPKKKQRTVCDKQPRKKYGTVKKAGKQASKGKGKTG